MPDRFTMTKRDLKHEMMNALTIVGVATRRLGLTESNKALEALVDQITEELKTVDLDS